jgi:hypothetical protein
MREYLVVCFLSCRVKESCPGEQRIDRIKYSLNPIETYYNIQVVLSSLSRLNSWAPFGNFCICVCVCKMLLPVKKAPQMETNDTYFCVGDWRK